MIVDYIFFFKQKTAYDMRISDWSSDVCSSDLLCNRFHFCASLIRTVESIVMRRCGESSGSASRPMDHRNRGLQRTPAASAITDFGPPPDAVHEPPPLSEPSGTAATLARFEFICKACKISLHRTPAERHTASKTEEN